MQTVRRTMDTEVRDLGGGRLRAVARLRDPFHDIEVEIDLRIADRVVSGAQARMPRVPYADRCPDSRARLDGLAGMQIGARLSARVREAIGGECGCPYLVELVVQACKFAAVAIQAEHARDAVLVRPDPVRFAAIRHQMGQCAGHRGLPDDQLPAWLDRERRQLEDSGRPA